MNPSRERLRDLSAESGFRSDVLEKVLRLGELAGDVAKHPLLSTALALKGGTALNLCFGPPRRLSVDLDFNYVGGSDRERMLRDRPEVERAVQAIAEGRGYRIQRSRDEHAGRKLFLGYTNAAGTGDRVEVDLNFLFRVPLDSAWEAELWQPDGEAPRIRVVGPAELCAGKLCAPGSGPSSRPLRRAATPGRPWRGLADSPLPASLPCAGGHPRSSALALWSRTVPARHGRPHRHRAAPDAPRVGAPDRRGSPTRGSHSAHSATGVRRRRTRVQRAAPARRSLPRDPLSGGRRDRRKAAPASRTSVEGGKRGNAFTDHAMTPDERKGVARAS
jgi:hypothetical protein